MSQQLKGCCLKPKGSTSMNTKASRSAANSQQYRGRQSSGAVQDLAAPPRAWASSAARAGRAVAGAVGVARALVGGAVRGLQSLFVAGGTRASSSAVYVGESEEGGSPATLRISPDAGKRLWCSPPSSPASETDGSPRSSPRNSSSSSSSSSSPRSDSIRLSTGSSNSSIRLRKRRRRRRGYIP
jgi:hypothetical protein